jgi:hypothetical protein
MRHLPRRIWLIAAACLVAASMIVFTFPDNHSPVTSASGSTAISQKPLPPIDLRWVLGDVKKVAPSTPAGGGSRADFAAQSANAYTAEGKLVIRAQKAAREFLRTEPEVQITISTRGGVTVGSVKPIHFKLRAGVDDRFSLPFDDEIPLTIPVGQRGTIEAEATATSPDGKEKYGRKATMYLLADQRKLYNGSGGFLNLEIQKLKDDLADGTISQEKFQQEMDRLLGGGAVQSDTPTP